MKLRIGVLLAATSVCAGTVRAQDTTYVPASDFPSGRQIMAIYFGAKWCEPCMRPTTKDAIRRMKPILRAEAERRGATFTAIVVALDRRLDDGLAFTKDLGAFDEYAFGGDLAGLPSERFIWGDADPLPAVPQIVIGERTVTVERGKSMRFGPWRRIRRIGGDSIPSWVAAGAPIP